MKYKFLKIGTEWFLDVQQNSEHLYEINEKANPLSLDIVALTKKYHSILIRKFGSWMLLGRTENVLDVIEKNELVYPNS